MVQQHPRPPKNLVVHDIHVFACVQTRVQNTDRSGDDTGLLELTAHIIGRNNFCPTLFSQTTGQSCLPSAGASPNDDELNRTGSQMIESDVDTVGLQSRWMMVYAVYIGFGVLAWSSVPVLHAIGVTVGPGAVLALVLSAAFAVRRPAS